jgi:hypothetical protein
MVHSQKAVRRRSLQFTVRTLLLITAVIGTYLSVFTAERQDLRSRAQALNALHDSLSTFGCEERDWPWYSGWLHNLIGDPNVPTLEFAVFHNFGRVDDDALEKLTAFPELSQLWLAGELEITDHGLEYLKVLKNLKDLALQDARVSSDAVVRLRQCLPQCDIQWNGESSPLAASRD